MAKKFKDYYDVDCAVLIADKILKVYKKFDKAQFINYLTIELEEKEFLGRQDTFVLAFEKFLTSDFEKDINIFHKILGSELETTEGMFTYGWWLWPIGRYVEKHGTKKPKIAIDFIYELTKRFTGEFAIRPILEAEPYNTTKIMLTWSLDSNVHVRRLASEGMRISLPWAKKSLVALKEYELYKQILNNLKSDKEKFVQKSVGNNLNDLYKIEPLKALGIISEWEKHNPTKETLWIIKHGLRSQRKKLTT
jgi:3-methyladenine DNA glycosylase AlkC